MILILSSHESTNIGKNMRNRFVLTALAMVLAAAGAFARPVFKTNMTFSQPDGTTFLANVSGDEFLRIITTINGEAIAKDDDGWWSYAIYGDDGTKESTGIHVGSDGNGMVKAQSRFIPYEVLSERASLRAEAARDERMVPITRRILERDGAATKAEGVIHNKHGVVIICEYSDVKLAPGTTKSSFENMLSQTGYSSNGAEGCALEYFNHQFGDGWNFEFTVVGPITLPETHSYYGKNDKDGTEPNAAQMIADAIKAADPLVDYSKFDDDNDGYIDNIFVFYAGKDEADDADNNADCVWSHAWYLSSATLANGTRIPVKDRTFDGVIADRYACTSELANFGSYYSFATIGTFCHEYSHTLGLPDLYDTDYESTDGTHISAGLWRSTALMDAGNMNNHGNTPPNYNCIEKEIVGLVEPQPLREGFYTLKPIDQEGAVCLRYDHPSNDGEYFLFECRSTKSGWDSYIYGNGLYVYHIDRSDNAVAPRKTARETWLDNKVNAYHSHQCADLVEASGKNDKFIFKTFGGISTNDLKGLPFPYGSTHNFFSATSKPAFAFWDGTLSQFSIDGITVNADGSVSFSVSTSKAIPEITRYEYESFQNSAVISWISNMASDQPAYISFGKTGGKMKEMEVTSYNEGTSFAFVAEGLSPVSEYTVELYFKDGDQKGNVTTFKFQTGKSTSKIPPYIILSNAARDKTSGRFLKGCNIPLRVYNALNAESIVWYYNDQEVSIGPNGYFNPSESGILKAEIIYSNGTSEILMKTINIQTR